MVCAHVRESVRVCVCVHVRIHVILATCEKHTFSSVLPPDSWLVLAFNGFDQLLFLCFVDIEHADSTHSVGEKSYKLL